MTISKRRREYSLDLAKIVATTLILLMHYQQNFEGNYTFIQYFGGKFYFGYLVEFFFMLSGFFCIKMIIKADTFPIFIGRRVIRLWPIMIIAAIMDQALLIVYEILRGGNYIEEEKYLCGEQ